MHKRVLSGHISMASDGAHPFWFHAAGSQFCPHCGTLLVFSDLGDVQCDKCKYESNIADLPTLHVVTQSTPKPEAGWLKEYRASKLPSVAPEAAVSQRAVVKEECPKCKAPTMEFFTMQLRSADEGQTVFYECVKCGHKFSVNT